LIIAGLNKNIPKVKLRILKENGVPINTPATRKLQEQANIRQPKNFTSSLNQLHHSIINQKSISNEKQKEKNIRDKERMNLDNNDFQENSGFAILQNKENDNSNNGKPSKEKYIKLMNNKVKYSIEEELNSILYRITLGKLLDISPKVRSEVSKLLLFGKNNIISAILNFDPSITLVNNIDHSYDSNSKEVLEDELAMVAVTVGNITARLLIDTCSNVHVITSDFLSKISGYKKVGVP